MVVVGCGGGVLICFVGCVELVIGGCVVIVLMVIGCVECVFVVLGIVVKSN